MYYIEEWSQVETNQYRIKGLICVQNSRYKTSLSFLYLSYHRHPLSSIIWGGLSFSVGDNVNEQSFLLSLNQHLAIYRTNASSAFIQNRLSSLTVLAGKQTSYGLKCASCDLKKRDINLFYRCPRRFFFSCT